MEKPAEGLRSGRVVKGQNLSRADKVCIDKSTQTKVCIIKGMHQNVQKVIWNKQHKLQNLLSNITSNKNVKVVR